MFDKALITSCSNKFFPSVVNLLGSIKANYPNHPKIFIYDLGLLAIFRKELEQIENVEVISMPHFCSHWRACYTWKTYIFAHPVAKLNLYLDAGCQVLKSLDEDFETIERENFLLLDVGVTVTDVVPEEYRVMFSVSPELYNKPGFSAGIFGFKDSSDNSKLFHQVYNAAISGLSLGFSKNSLWRNRGKDKSIFIRNCELFRHDQSLLNLFFWINNVPKPEFHSHDDYSHVSPDFTPTQKIWHCRFQQKTLFYTKTNLLHTNNRQLYMLINRIMIWAAWYYKNIKTLWKQ